MKVYDASDVLWPIVVGVIVVAIIVFLATMAYQAQTGYNAWVAQHALFENYSVNCIDTDGTRFTFVPAK